MNPEGPKDPESAEPSEPPPPPRPWAWEPEVSDSEPEPESDDAPAPAPEPGGETPPPVPPPPLAATHPPDPPPPLGVDPRTGVPTPLEPSGEQRPSAAAVLEPPGPPPPMAPPRAAWERPPSERYPMRFDVEYPEGLSRWKTLLRIVLFIPVYLFLSLIQYFVFCALFIGFTTVFWRKKYPLWLFDGLSGAFGFTARSYSYLLLVSDKFPSFSKEDSPVTLEYDPPPSGHLSRWRVLFWKFVLLIPHIFVLYFIGIAVFAVTVIAWFAILFTGNYPRGMFQFIVGVQRWWWRVTGYFASFNDRFPPYALSAEAGPASKGSTVANGLIGAGAVASLAAIITVAALIDAKYVTENVDYARLEAGAQQPVTTFTEDITDDEILLRLVRVTDPGDALAEVLRPANNERLIVFQWTVVNRTNNAQLVAGDAARLKFAYEKDGDDQEKSVTAEIIGVNNVIAPANVRDSNSATVQAVFVVPSDAEPLELRFRNGFAGGGVKYVFD